MPIANGDQRSAGHGDSFKCGVEIFQGIFTILAIILGGAWFIVQSSLHPMISLEQKVEQRPYGTDGKQTLVTVNVKVTNTGKTEINLECGKLYAEGLNPPPDDDHRWKITPLNMGNCEKEPLKAGQVSWLQTLRLEPGESDQATKNLTRFLVPSWAQTITIKSQYAVPDRWFYTPPADAKFWNLTTDLDINPLSAKKENDASKLAPTGK